MDSTFPANVDVDALNRIKDLSSEVLDHLHNHFKLISQNPKFHRESMWIDGMII